jgi:hypothetical protein
MAGKKKTPKTGPLFPQVRVRLTGTDGNAFFILGRVSKAAERAGVSQADVDQFMNEAMSGDYDHLLATCVKYFDVS